MSVFRPVYDFAIKQAEKPYATWLLFFVALIEPCFFPLPPDTLLIPMAIARRDNAYWYSGICTLGSVLGGLIGYAIGALAMATVGHWIVDTYHLHDKFEAFSHMFKHWGMWIILAKGLTPLPFIIVTVASGVVHLNIVVFILSATLTRGGRFFLEGFLIHKYGDHVRGFIEKYLTWIGLGVLAIILGGVWLLAH
jgi:membrane protein YqaA with SNARE-associated domain